MPSNLKRIVRKRMGKTGESYQQALRQVRAHVRTNAEATPVALACARTDVDESGVSGSIGVAPRLVDVREIASKIARPPIEVASLGRIVLARMTATRGGGVQ